MKKQIVILPLFLSLLFVSGCNIFSPFTPESDNALTLLEQGKAALQAGENQRALDLFTKAMDINSTNHEIRYFHAVATVRVNGLDFQDFIDAFQGNQSMQTSSSNQQIYAEFLSGDIDTLFSLAESNLQRIVAIFWTVQTDLEPVVNAIKQGTIDPTQFIYTDDALLSSAISTLVNSLIFLLDDDGIGPEFHLDSRVLLQKAGDAYNLIINGQPQAGFATIEEEVQARIRRQWPGFAQGLQNLYFYYEWTQFNKLPQTGPVPPQPLPGDLNSSIAGEIFRMAYSGVEALWQAISS